MTREEALKWLHELETMKFAWDGAKYHEAVGIAIEMIENSKRPTNLDIYLCDSEDDTCLCLYENTYEDYIKATNYEISYLDWLQQPYEEPPKYKLKYKLSKFEYDLLHTFNECVCFKDSFILIDLQKKGHFKYIDKHVRIGYILDNCEVIDE